MAHDLIKFVENTQKISQFVFVSLPAVPDGLYNPKPAGT